MKKIIITAWIISSLALGGCSSSQNTSSDYDSTNYKNKTENSEGLKCNESISIQEGETLNLGKYCTYNGEKNDDIVVSPSTVSTKKIGKQSLDVTVTDPNGVIYYYNINVNVTAKPTPTPSPTPTPTPTPEETTDATPETVAPSTNNKSNNNYSSSNSNSSSSYTQQQAPVQQPVTEPATQPSGQQTAGEGDAVTTKKKANGGAAAGTTYDSVAACDAAAATTQSHTCTFNAELQKYVLTY